MVYSTSRCPSCGKVIKRQTNPVHEIGNPFESCRWCGNIYLNPYKEEWITKSPIKRFFFYLQAGVWARAFLVSMLVLIIPMVAFDMSTEAFWVLWPIMSVTWLIVGYFVHKKAEHDDIVKSIERTKDTEYLNLLKKAGYKIYPLESCQEVYQPKPNTYQASTTNVKSANGTNNQIFAKNFFQKRKKKIFIITIIIALIIGLTVGIVAFLQSNKSNGQSPVNEIDKGRPETVINVAVRTISLSDKFTAEYVLATWENGQAIEQTMIETMNKYGTSQGGGKLYVIKRGEFVEEIDEWCFSSNRKVGDYAIIENAYGYTICYISGFNK